MTIRPLYVLALSGLALVAQVNTSSISGTVLDPSNAAVAGASVTLVNEETGVKLGAKTTEAGNYLFAPLQRGMYRIEQADDDRCRDYSQQQRQEAGKGRLGQRRGQQDESRREKKSVLRNDHRGTAISWSSDATKSGAVIPCISYSGRRIRRCSSASGARNLISSGVTKSRPETAA